MSHEAKMIKVLFSENPAGLLPVAAAPAGVAKGLAVKGATGKAMQSLALGQGSSVGASASQVLAAAKGAGSGLFGGGLKLGLGAGLLAPMLLAVAAAAIGVGVCNHLRRLDSAALMKVPD